MAIVTEMITSEARVVESKTPCGDGIKTPTGDGESRGVLMKGSCTCRAVIRRFPLGSVELDPGPAESFLVVERRR